MAKAKNKKRSTSEKVNNNSSRNVKKKLNPFELHINREKIKVLGRKLKNDRGLPGVARSKALKKRKHTLLQEYKSQNKANKFLDKRIGERNLSLTHEDKALARFAAERVKAHKKKSIFNLADDEVLTHKGQTLSEIEKFEDIRSDDEESIEGDNKGKLDKNFVEDAHFGGGIFKNTGKEGFKTHKELIEQLIAESKKRKAEKQKIKEATLELTEKLDSEWRDLLPLVNKSKKNKDDTSKPDIDEYDKVMHELKFEARGAAGDRLKTEDEIAKEEKEMLENQEKERLERMRGFTEDTKKITHRSADDLEDDFMYDDDPEVTLSYNEQGESNVAIDAEMSKKDSAEEESQSDKEEEEEEGDSNEESEESDEEDNLSDLKEDDSEDEEEESVNEEENIEGNLKRKSCVVDVPPIKKLKSDSKNSDEIRTDLLKRKAAMEKARNELPYTFEMPDSYETLEKLLQNHPSVHQGVIIERIIKCHHPSLGDSNKENLSMLFVYLLQYLNDIFSETNIKKCFDTFCALLPHFFDLAQFNKEGALNSIVEVITEKHEEYRKRPTVFPQVEMLLYLKLVGCLFTTSDFRHQAVTPCFVFMEQMLSRCRVRTRRDIAYGLYVANLVLEYTSLSKRYLPASITFLSGLLHMAIPKSGVQLIKVLPPFKSTSSLLVLSDEIQETGSFKIESTDLIRTDIDDDFKICAIYTAVNLLSGFHDILSTLPSCVEIFNIPLKYLKLLRNDNYPGEVQKALDELVGKIEAAAKNRSLDYIVMEKKRPKALRLYEPKIVPVYDYKRHKPQSREKAERDKLLYKLKKETKGALREIRRDQAFLGKVKIQQKIQSDMERKQKVKQIYAEAAMQQSELKSLERKKKHK